MWVRDWGNWRHNDLSTLGGSMVRYGLDCNRPLFEPVEHAV
jgi:hypothetical protein